MAVYLPEDWPLFECIWHVLFDWPGVAQALDQELSEYGAL